MGWLWQNLVSDLIWLGIVAAAGILFAWLRKRHVQWLPYLSYGLFASVLTAALLYMFTGHPLFSTQRPDTTPNNVEQNIKAWADMFGYSVQTVPQSLYYFQLTLTLRDGVPITIVRPREKGREQYLIFESKITVSPEHEKTLAGFTDEQNQAVLDDIVFEIAKLKVGYSVDASPRIKSVDMSKPVPITRSFTDATLDEYITEMDTDVNAIRQAFLVAIRHAKQSTH